jgi:multicomponent Na+:H+ antiporter subunit D
MLTAFNISDLILAIIITPLLCALLSFKIFNKNSVVIINILSSLSNIILIGICFYFKKFDIEITLISQILPGIGAVFKTESFAVVFALTCNIIWLLNNIFSYSETKKNHVHEVQNFYGYSSLAFFAITAICLSHNLFMISVFYLVMIFSITKIIETDSFDISKRDSKSYIRTLLPMMVLFLSIAAFATYNTAGNLYFSGTPILKKLIDEKLISIILVLYILGISSITVTPFYRWFLNTSDKNFSHSSILVVSSLTGIFVLIKIFTGIFALDNLYIISQKSEYLKHLPWIFVLTILSCGALALTKNNLEKRVKYIIIASYACCVLGLTSFTESGLLAAEFGIISIAFSASALLFAIRAIKSNASLKYLGEIKGEGKIMPITFAVLSIAALSIIGLPPLSGAVFKFHLMNGIFENQFYFIFVIIVATTISAFCFAPVMFSAFNYKESRSDEVMEAPYSQLLAMVVCIIITLLLFIFPQYFV